MYRGGIILKTPEQIEEMAAAGAIQARCLKMLRSKVRPGVTTEELDHAAERFITSQGIGPVVPRLPGLPRLDLRLAELDGRPRDSGAVRACARRRDLDRRRRHPRGLGRRRGDHGRGRRDQRRGPAVARDDRGGAVRRRSRRRRPATTSATSRTRFRSGSRPTASRSSARWSATGSVAICTRTRRSPTTASPAAAPSSSRAWCSRSSRWSTPVALTSASATTTGPSTRPTARSPRTSSSRRGDRGRASDPHALASSLARPSDATFTGSVAIFLRRPSGRFVVPAVRFMGRRGLLAGSHSIRPGKGR